MRELGAVAAAAAVGLSWPPDGATARPAPGEPDDCARSSRGDERARPLPCPPWARGASSCTWAVSGILVLAPAAASDEHGSREHADVPWGSTDLGGVSCLG